MKKYSLIVTLCLLASQLAGCGKTDYEELVEVKPNETAFVVKLEGDTEKGQAAFDSEAFLIQKKVALKRIVIPHRKRNDGGNSYSWIPTIKVILIDRSPVTREWTASDKKGTSPSNQAISVESSESIDFSIGVTMTASVPETLAPKFLYNYAGKQLTEIADTNIRGYIQTILSREFGSRSLTDARLQKKEIFEMAFKESKEHFAEKGILIDNLGFADGMTYADPKIQQSINETFEAAMSVDKARFALKEAELKRAAAEEFAKAKDAAVAKTNLEIAMIMAKAQAEALEKKWNGAFPANVVPPGTQMLMGLDSTVAPKK